MKREDDAVDITATVSLDRGLPTVAGLLHAIVDARAPGGGELTCQALVEPGGLDGENVLSAGQKTLSGGTYHPDLPMGRAPPGRVLLAVFGTAEAAGAGEVLGHGCVGPIDASAPSVTIPLVDVGP